MNRDILKTIFGIFVIGLIVVATFLYGNKQRQDQLRKDNEAKQAQTQQTAQNTGQTVTSGNSTAEKPQSTDTVQQQNSDVQQTQTNLQKPAATSQTPTATPTPATTPGSGGTTTPQPVPTRTPNTGSEGFLYAAATAAMLLVARRYLASKRELENAQRGF